MNKCLICYNHIENRNSVVPYHKDCLQRSFLKDIDPIVPYKYSDLNKLASQIIQKSFSVTGVQTKISLGTVKEHNSKKLTIVGYKNEYILKPPANNFRQLPENEDLTMKLARMANIPTVEQALIPMESGEIAYITKRMDRNKDKKIHMEDMAQIGGKLTEQKYNGSLESVGKNIFRYSENKMFDVITFFDLILFCFLTGNTDMHLKNFSMLYSEFGLRLAPAYDLLNTTIITADPEQSALTINGKKNKIQLIDFNAFADTMKITPKSRDTIYKKYSSLKTGFTVLIESSLLENDLKEAYRNYFLSACEKVGC